MPPVRKSKVVKAPKQPQNEPSEKKIVVSGQLEKKIKKQQSRVKERRGVVFIKHLPHGFFEEQLKGYFQQFGNVTRLRLSRSKRTGGSKGYAFIEFEHPEVAEVAAETMDNYLMFQKLVKAAYIPPEQQKYNYFKTGVRKVKNKAGKEIYVSHKTAAIQRKARQHNDWSEDNYQKRTLRNLKKIEKMSEKYADLGIDFSNIVIKPNKVTNENKTVTPGKLEKNLLGKAKSKEVAKKSAGKLSKTNKKEVQLEDLLGNTINDDSDDEDYIAMPESEDESGEQQDEDSDVDDDDDDDNDDDATSSDEETYGFSKSSDDEKVVSKTKKAKPTQKAKAVYGKSLKGSKVDRFEQMIKRKPQTGAVQKAKNATKSIPAKKGKKNPIQVAAAKEILKTLPTGKTNINAKTKQVGKKQKLRK